MNDPDLYLVRVWHSDAGFRASARHVDTEEPRLFASPLELAHYLAEPREEAEPPAAPKATPPTRGA